MKLIRSLTVANVPYYIYYKVARIYVASVMLAICAFYRTRF
jgi:hypothetical protein